MKRWGITLAVGTVVAIIGCTTFKFRHEIDAHITVEIRQIRDQAESIVDFIEGKTDTLAPAEAAEPNPGARAYPALYELVVPLRTAYAAERLKQDSPRVRELAEKMRERRPKIEELLAKGYLGESNRGYLTVLDHEELKEPERKNAVQKLAAEENADRKELYREIVRLNQETNATLELVERVFAQVYRSRAKAGQHVQLPSPGEDFEEFKNSPLGKKLAGEAEPNAWVKIPESSA